MEKSDVKLIEVRDRGTCMPMLAVRLTAQSENERWLLERSGYYGSALENGEYVLLVELLGGSGRANCDPYDWNTSSRTVPIVHKHLIASWGTVAHTQVVDVEHILGEVEQPKRSDRFNELESAAPNSRK